MLESSYPRAGQNPEACDDGNDVDGDGCSSTCQVEQLAAGQPCTNKKQCLEGSCVGGVCRPITNELIKTPLSVTLERDNRFPTSLATSGSYAFFGGFSPPICDDPGNLDCRFQSTIQVFRKGNAGEGQAWVYHSRIDLEPGQSFMLGGTLKAAADFLAMSGIAGRANGYGIHLYQRKGDQWSKVSQLQIPDSTPRPLGEDFGTIMDMDENRLIVGVPWNPCLVAIFDDGACTLDPMKQKGRVFVFERSQDEWKLAHTLFAPGADNSNGFGQAVSLTGSRIVVGESMDPFCERYSEAKDLPICQDSGKVHVFDFDGTAWQHQATLESPAVPQDSSFGSSVSHEGSTLVVGAPAEQECCMPPARSGVIPTPRSTVPYAQAGAAHVYTHSSTGWIHHRRLVSAFMRSGSQFGRAVGVRGKRVVVGSSNEHGLCRNGFNAVNAFAQVLVEPSFHCQGSPLETFYFENDAWGRETILFSRFPGGLHPSYARSFEMTPRSVLALDQRCDQAGGLTPPTNLDACSGGALGVFFEFSYDE